MVIRCFDEGHPTRTLTETAAAAGLTRAAARRFLLTLQALGYVESVGRNFRLLPKTLELGYAYLASQPWWRHAQRIAERLGAEQGQACAVGVLDRDAVAYVAYAPAVNLPSLVRTVGTRLPAHATAIGRVLLAGLSEEAFAGISGRRSSFRSRPDVHRSRQAEPSRCSGRGAMATRSSTRSWRWDCARSACPSSTVAGAPPRP